MLSLTFPSCLMGLEGLSDPEIFEVDFHVVIGNTECVAFAVLDGKITWLILTDEILNTFT